MNGPKVIVATGAASGMARAAALRWARQGHKVAAVDRSADGVKALEAEFDNISGYECDVSDEDAVRRVAGEIESQLGPIDRLLNAAGICLNGKIGEAPPQDFRRTMEVNFFGTVHWVDAVLPGMRARRRGEIVLFSSIGGFLPSPGVDAYVASKFAVLGYAEILFQEAKPDGIRVICICPPPVDTPLLDNFKAAGPTKPLPSWSEKLMNPMTPDQIIDSIEEALPGKRFLLLPNSNAKASYLMRRLAPNTLNRLLVKITGL